MHMPMYESYVTFSHIQGYSQNIHLYNIHISQKGFLAAETHLPPGRVQISHWKPLHGCGTHDFSLAKVAKNTEAWSVRGAMPRFNPFGGRCKTITYTK